MLFNNLDIILASGSPRRKELLAGMCIPFRIAELYSVDEVYPDELEPHKVPVYLAELKSKAYPNPLNNNQILITADTVVILGQKVIGKPKDRDEAIKTLTALAGKTHEVTTGIMLRSNQASKILSETARVTFGPLSREEIEFYVDNFQPYDKAGAYGIQEWIGYVGIERIEGSFHNVMGLPTRMLYTALSDFTKTQYTDNQ